MMIAERLRALRESKKLTQGDIERRTGLLRCYVSRVENGHTVPSLETLEKWAYALAVPLYRLFYDGEEPPAVSPTLKDARPTEETWRKRGRGLRTFNALRTCLGKMNRKDRYLLLHLVQKMAGLRAARRSDGAARRRTTES